MSGGVEHNNNINDNNHSDSPVGVAIVDAVSNESIDEGPQMVVISALILDSDSGSR